VKVTDGDTIKVQLASGPITVRFGYVDAPERNRPWGERCFCSEHEAQAAGWRAPRN
jgi:endonuclease YncB( thermonuclease family)